MTLLEAAVLGTVEGLTEFLPVSSTGHLILTARALGLAGESMDAFEVVIQAGALAAVLGLYRERVGELLQGAVRPHPRGRALLLKLTVAAVPALALGLAGHHWIKDHLFRPRPVALALLLGGIAILAYERWRRARPAAPRFATLDDLPLAAAAWIGLAQCLSLWPGTSRAMVTILAALLLGAGPVAAAEFSFLLALPTLGAATLFDLWKNFDALTSLGGGPAPLLIGLGSAAAVAAVAIRSFLRYLTRRGLEPFGWYRIAVGAALVVLFWSRPELLP